MPNIKNVCWESTNYTIKTMLYTLKEYPLYLTRIDTLAHGTSVVGLCKSKRTHHATRNWSTCRCRWLARTLTLISVFETVVVAIAAGEVPQHALVGSSVIEPFLHTLRTAARLEAERTSTRRIWPFNCSAKRRAQIHGHGLGPKHGEAHEYRLMTFLYKVHYHLMLTGNGNKYFFGVGDSYKDLHGWLGRVHHIQDNSVIKFQIVHSFKH